MARLYSNQAGPGFAPYPYAPWLPPAYDPWAAPPPCAPPPVVRRRRGRRARRWTVERAGPGGRRRPPPRRRPSAPATPDAESPSP